MNYDDDSDGLGKGGPVQLALQGRHFVAGFANGTLAKFLLPEEFDKEDSSNKSSANHLSSFSSLPSDEWYAPILECADDY